VRTASVVQRRWMDLLRSAPWIDEEATAFPWYFEIFNDWMPMTIATRTLFVRATEPMPGTEGEVVPGSGDWRPHWEQPHDLKDLRGDHFTLFTDHSDATARAVHDWLSALES
jgi:hypothetical protein